MNKTIITIIIAILSGCNTDINNKTTKVDGDYFYVGTYTDGESDGIYKYKLNYDGSLDSIGLVAITENPSFLALSSDKKYLVTCNEINSADGQGTVESYKIDGDSLTFINRSLSGGAHPCFVAIEDKGYVLTANYTGGNIGLLKLNDNGELSLLLDVEQHYGEGDTERQDKPHAHSVWLVPNTDEVISVDLGTNELWFSKIDSISNKLTPENPQKLSLEKGAGPRHLSFHPKQNFIYVLNELNSTISLVRKNDIGNYEILNTISTLPIDFVDKNTCADIHVSSDGKFLYASNRGHNSIAIFNIDDENGELSIIGFESTMGDGPRNFTLSLDGKFLLVANQNTNNIVSFKRNIENGELVFVSEVNAPKPVCLLFE